MRHAKLIVVVLAFAVGAVALRAQAPGSPPRVSQRGGVEVPGSPPRVSQRGGMEAPAAGYLLPPTTIVDILDAAPPPTVELSPARDTIAELERASMPTIAELAQPMFRLAGVRINPRTNGPHRSANRYRRLVLKVVADGSERAVTLPSSPVIAWIGFSPDGRRLAFTNTRENGIELWIGDAATGRARAVTTPSLNASLGTPCSWVENGASMICAFVDATRGAPPVAPQVPTGPNIQENRGRSAPAPTYQDLLASAHDEALFAYYATSQLAIVDLASGERSPIGRAAIYRDFRASPDGRYVLAARVERPFSWLVPYDDFSTTVEVWDRKGAVVKTIATLPAAENVPRDGVPAGPRQWRWHALKPATVVWTEALDGGDPKNRVPERDKLVALDAPFTGAPVELARTEWRLTAAFWTTGGVALVTESDRPTRMTRTWAIDAQGKRKLWERNSEDAYNNPGTFVRQSRASGADGIFQTGDAVYLTGPGSSPHGDRPFLDRLTLRTGAKDRLFQSDIGGYEPVVGLLSDDGSTFLTRYETRTSPPNVYVRGRESSSRRPLTAYRDPAPPLQGAKAEMVTYQRADGVQLRATIYTPAGWTPAQGRLPALLWAYPREFADPDFAGQVTGSPYRFTVPGWSTLHLLFLTQGYAVIDDPTMPIVGPGETANDTYVEQLVASARAAVDKAAAMGVVDPERVVVGGHSYGAFMTANLLANSDVFRAGIARSGAYNRTLTPFGFQNERRTFWEVPQVYMRMSPFAHANTINEPILLIHGEADDNSGTFPIQSERLYRALKGHGATVRYVTLPHEAHGYAARESILHTVAEMLNWANEWGKNAKPRTTTSAGK